MLVDRGDARRSAASPSPLLFAQAARTKNPELFLAISLLIVILASLATAAVGLSPILGALIAGVLIAETEYHAEVEAITAPFAGLALGIFLITVGMRIDLGALARATGPLILGAAAAVLIGQGAWSPRRCCGLPEFASARRSKRAC